MTIVGQAADGRRASLSTQPAVARRGWEGDALFYVLYGRDEPDIFDAGPVVSRSS